MTSTSSVRPGALVGALVTAISLALAAPAAALTQVSRDPFTNSTSQHATEVEPDTFAFGSTVVAAFQTGRFFNGGASDIGYVRSGDGGATWPTASFVPGLTNTSSSGPFGDPASPYERVSDASVAYDARHATWMISSIPLTFSTSVPKIDVSLSTDDGQTFPTTVTLPDPPAKKIDLDKNWTACDNRPQSRFYGHCYTEFDNFAEGDLEYMSTSTDGGRTWSVPVAPAGNPHGLGGQPVVQPNGNVIVPFESLKGSIGAFVSTDGGVSWSHEFQVSKVKFHPVAGDLRTSPLPTAEIDGSGRAFVAWEDCRFQPKCSANDIVLSHSDDGANWSAVSRIPTDPVGNGTDHFIPGLGVDINTAGSGAHLALNYSYYKNANCTEDTCEIFNGYISSPDGGAHWGDSAQLAGPTKLTDVADTSQGPMTGDYVSTSFNGAGTAATVFALGLPHASGAPFDEGMWTPGLLPVATPAQATHPATTAGAAGGPGVGAAQKAVRGD